MWEIYPLNFFTPVSALIELKSQRSLKLQQIVEFESYKPHTHKYAHL